MPTEEELKQQAEQDLAIPEPPPPEPAYVPPETVYQPPMGGEPAEQLPETPPPPPPVPVDTTTIQLPDGGTVEIPDEQVQDFLASAPDAVVVAPLQPAKVDTSVINLPSDYEFTNEPYDQFVKMAIAGATVAELLKFTQDHPDAVRGAYAGRLNDQITSQIYAAYDLSGKTQFNEYKKLGLIPIDAKYVATADGKWAYSLPSAQPQYQMPADFSLTKSQLTYIRTALPEAYKLLNEQGLDTAFATYGNLLVMAKWEADFKKSDPQLFEIYRSAGSGQTGIDAVNAYITEYNAQIITPTIEPAEQTGTGKLVIVRATKSAYDTLGDQFQSQDKDTQQFMIMEAFYNMPNTAKKSFDQLTTKQKQVVIDYYVGGLLSKEDLAKYEDSKLTKMGIAMAPVAGAEPTPIGEIVMGLLILAGVASITLSQQKNLTRAINDFIAGYGRSPTVKEVAVTFAGGATVPLVSLTEQVNLDTTLPPITSFRIDTRLPFMTPPMLSTRLPAFTPPMISTRLPYMTPPQIATRLPAFVPPRIDVPTMIMTVATATYDLVSNPAVGRVMTPSELARLWGEPPRPTTPYQSWQHQPEPYQSWLHDTKATPWGHFIYKPGVFADLDRVMSGAIPTASYLHGEDIADLDQKIYNAYANGTISQSEYADYQSARARYIKAKYNIDTYLDSLIASSPVLLQSSLPKEAIYAGLLLAIYISTRTRTKENPEGMAMPEVVQATQAEIAEMTNTKVASSAQTRTAIQAIAQMGMQVASQTSVQPLSQTVVQAMAQTETQTQTAEQMATQTAEQTKAQVATKTATQTATKTAEMTRTAEATREAVREAETVREAEATAVASMTGVPIKFPLLGGVGSKKRVIIPIGSLTWRMGIFWKYIPAPWKDSKPQTSRYAPKGADISGRTPQETLQVIGERPARVPKSFSIDLGVVDAFITDYGKTITFTGHGTLTDVGSRIASPTTGMSVDEGGGRNGEYLEESSSEMPAKRVRSGRSAIIKSRPRRKSKQLSESEKMTTLKGFRI